MNKVDLFLNILLKNSDREKFEKTIPEEVRNQIYDMEKKFLSNKGIYPEDSFAGIDYPYAASTENSDIQKKRLSIKFKKYQKVELQINVNTENDGDFLEEIDVRIYDPNRELKGKVSLFYDKNKDNVGPIMIKGNVLMGGIFNHINISKYKIKVLSEDNIKVMIG
jgi:hypothetical protein